MNNPRIFPSDHFMQPAQEGEPIRSIVTESPDATVVAWHILPGQRIACHVHPHGQDTWTILSGQGVYQMDAAGDSNRTIVPGDVVVAHRNQVHGVHNHSDVPLRFISVVAPAGAGFELV